MSDNLLPPKSGKDSSDPPNQGPMPSHLKQGNKQNKSVNAPSTKQPAPAQVAGKYCPKCDALIPVEATSCSQCQATLEESPAGSSTPGSSTPTIKTKSKRRQPVSRRRGKQKKPDSVALQMIKMFSVTAVFALGYLIYWLMDIPVGDGIVKSKNGDIYLVHVHRLDYVVEVRKKNTDGSLAEDVKVKVSRQMGEYHARKLKK